LTTGVLALGAAGAGATAISVAVLAAGTAKTTGLAPMTI
jgi:hypothetical protein